MTAPLDRRTDYRITFGVLCLGVASFSLLQSMVNPVLPTIAHALDTDQATVTWVLTAYLVSASVFTPIIGRVGDKVGKERMLVVALAALAVGSLLAAVATSVGVMIAARVIQGIGGGVLPLTFGIIRDEFPREKVAAAIGTSSALLAVGGGVGLVIAGPVVDALSYHWLFWIPMVMTVVAAVAAALWVPESPERAPGRINVGTALLLSAWLVALLLGVSQGHVWGWGSARVIGLFVAAAVLLPTWVVAEARSRDPLVDMAMMRIPTVWTVNLVALLFGFGMYSSFAFLPQFLQTPEVAGYGFGASVTESGLLLLPQTVASFVAGVLAGRLAARFGSKALLVVGATLTAAGTLGLTVAHGQLWQVIAATVVLGFSFGMAFAAMSNLVVDAVPQSQTGVASGMNTNIRTVGGAIGSAVIASVVTSQVQPSGFPVEAGYTHGFLVLTLTGAAAALVAVFVPVVRARTHVVPGPQAEAEAEAEAVLAERVDEPDFGVLLSVAYGTFFDRLHEHLRERGFDGFTSRTGFVLRVLGPGSMSLRELADVLEMSSPAALKVIDAMERVGYVERVPVPRDRRVRAVKATARGHAALAAARRFHAEFERGLGADGPALRAGLTVIADQASAAIPQVLRRTPAR